MRDSKFRVLRLDCGLRGDRQPVLAAVLGLLVVGLMPLALAQNQMGGQEATTGGLLGGAAFMDWNTSQSMNNPFNVARTGANLTISGGGMNFQWGRNSATLNNLVAVDRAEQSPSLYTRLENYSNHPNIGPSWTIADCLLRYGKECSRWGFYQGPTYPVSLGESTAEASTVYDAYLTTTNATGDTPTLIVSGPGLPTSVINIFEVTIGGTRYLTVPVTAYSLLGGRPGFPAVYVPAPYGKVALDSNGDGVADNDVPTSINLSPRVSVPIPTLSEWGMLIMLAMLMGYGIFRLRRSGNKLSLS